jgi:hypothetical protein
VIRIALLFASLPLAACAASAQPPDAPVPASEPRAIVRLHVDLVRAQDCEEAFDLALYRSRAVELVAWDPGAGRCADRTVTIRYLPRQASREDVVRAAAAVAAKVDALPEPNGDHR